MEVSAPVQMSFSSAELIPARELTSLMLIRAAAATVPSKLANTLVKKLCMAYPMPPNLKHLKRVRKATAGERNASVESESVNSVAAAGGEGGSLDIILCCFPELGHNSDQLGSHEVGIPKR